MRAYLLRRHRAQQLGVNLKVVLINSDSGYGSTGRIACDLYKAILAQGNEALIGYGREGTDDSIHNVRIGNKLDVYSHALKTRLFDMQGFGSVNATKRFIKKLEKFEPDIIHLHNIHGSYINVKLLFDYLKRIKKPVIWTLHDCWSFTGHCAYYTYARCNKWKTECHHCIQKHIYPASYYLDNSRNNYHLKKELFNGVENLTITCVSNWLRDEVKKSYLRGYDVRVIPNGIDLSIFKPTESNFRLSNHLENKTIILGVASIWQDRKGLWLFQELAETLEDQYQIVLVGVTKKQSRQLSSKIFFISRTNNIKELAELYTAADIFLNPSIEETFGMVSLEALACGTPVITNKYTANPELIKEDCGIIVNDIKTHLYREAIYQLKNEPKNSNACILRAQRYDKNNCYQAYLDLYKVSEELTK